MPSEFLSNLRWFWIVCYIDPRFSYFLLLGYKIYRTDSPLFSFKFCPLLDNVLYRQWTPSIMYLLFISVLKCCSMLSVYITFSSKMEIFICQSVIHYYNINYNHINYDKNCSEKKRRCTYRDMQISVGSRRAWSHYRDTVSKKNVKTSADCVIKILMNTFLNFNIVL